MKITMISSQKKDNEKFNIFVDNEYSFSAEAIDIIKYNIITDRDITEDELSFLIQECEVSKALKYAFDLVSRQYYTSKEIRNRLSNRKYNENTISRVILRLTELNLIDDNDYAEKFIKDGINIKKQGKKKILYDLNKKGIDKNLICEIEIDEKQELENALYLAEKKYTSLKGKDNVREKLYRFLLSKGYDYEMSKKAVNSVIHDSQEFIEY